MKRPLADSRPVGPLFEQRSGVCTLRFRATYKARSMPNEAKQSLVTAMEEEVIGITRLDNTTITMSSTDGVIEVATDLVQKEISDDDEDALVKAFGRVLMDGGAERVELESYSYRAVSR